MSKIITKIVHAASIKHNKQFKKLVEQEAKVEAEILDLELKLATLQQAKYKIEKEIAELERKIIESLI